MESFYFLNKATRVIITVIFSFKGSTSERSILDKYFILLFLRYYIMALIDLYIKLLNYN